MLASGKPLLIWIEVNYCGRIACRLYDNGHSLSLSSRQHVEASVDYSVSTVWLLYTLAYLQLAYWRKPSSLISAMLIRMLSVMFVQRLRSVRSQAWILSGLDAACVYTVTLQVTFARVNGRYMPFHVVRKFAWPQTTDISTDIIYTLWLLKEIRLLKSILFVAYVSIIRPIVTCDGWLVIIVVCQHLRSCCRACRKYSVYHLYARTRNSLPHYWLVTTHRRWFSGRTLQLNCI